jgi:hypothetical protein
VRAPGGPHAREDSRPGPVSARTPTR